MFLAVLAVLGIVVVILALIVAFSALTGWIFMLLWNFAMPVFWVGAPHIDFLHAWAAWVLVSLVISLITWSRQK